MFTYLLVFIFGLVIGQIIGTTRTNKKWEDGFTEMHKILGHKGGVTQ